jgi:RHS repeat-associated protein
MSESVVSGATTTWHDYLSIDGQLIAMRSCTGVAPCSTGATMDYLTLDHLGSIAAVTNDAAAVVERDAYDPWGRRRNINGTDDPSCALTSVTTRGFTSHEHMPAICEINANARIYDPTIGRFLSPDATIPNPFSGQSFNRYSYVENGPLSQTDPTGFTNGSSSLPCYGCWGPGIESDSDGQLVTDEAAAAYRRLDPSGGGVTIVDKTSGDQIGTCNSVSSCADLINRNYSSVSSISSSIGTEAFDGGPGAATSASSISTSPDGTDAGSDPPHYDVNGTETVVVAANSQKDMCIERCSDLALPTQDYGTTFDRCMQQCMGTGNWPEWEPHFPPRKISPAPPSPSPPSPDAQPPTPHFYLPPWWPLIFLPVLVGVPA